MMHIAAVMLAAMGQVELRGGEAAPAGQIVAVDAAGVHLSAPTPDSKPAERAGPEVIVIGWDRVRGLGGAEKGEWAKYEAVADKAWRARTRLERGDFIAAEPVFEELFSTYRGQAGPTAEVISEGLLRCRLRRAAHVAAVEPWLGMIKATAGGRAGFLHHDWAGEAGMVSVLDESTGLVPALPPIWVGWPSVEVLARTGLSGWGENGKKASVKSGVLAEIYVQAARYEAGMPATLPELATNDVGVAIAWQIVQARIGSADQRADARKELLARVAPGGGGWQAPAPWLEAWCRAGIGRSIIREEAADMKRLGVVELLNVPARFGSAHPYLAGIALAEASVTLRSMGDVDGSEVLARELAALYPTHPVNDWAMIRAVAPAKPAGPVTKPAHAKEGATSDGVSTR